MGIVRTQIGQQDMLTSTDSPRDRLTDLTGSDDGNEIVIAIPYFY